jgi:hypothetical protein
LYSVLFIGVKLTGGEYFLAVGIGVAGGFGDDLLGVAGLLEVVAGDDSPGCRRA